MAGRLPIVDDQIVPTLVVQLVQDVIEGKVGSVSPGGGGESGKAGMRSRTPNR